MQKSIVLAIAVLGIVSSVQATTSGDSALGFEEYGKASNPLPSVTLSDNPEKTTPQGLTPPEDLPAIFQGPQGTFLAKRYDPNDEENPGSPCPTSAQVPTPPVESGKNEEVDHNRVET